MPATRWPASLARARARLVVGVDPLWLTPTTVALVPGRERSATS